MTSKYFNFTNFVQASEAKLQRDEALNHVQLLTDKLEQISNGQNGSIAIPKDLRGLSIQKLKTLQVCYNLINNFISEYERKFTSNLFFYNEIILFFSIRKKLQKKSI